MARNPLAFKPPTYRIHECEGQIEARLLAHNLLATKAGCFTCWYKMRRLRIRLPRLA